MRNSENDFYGRQENEKILYVVRPHPFPLLLRMAKIYGVAILVFVALFMIGSQIVTLSGIFTLLGVVIALLMVLIGTKILSDSQKRNMSYITDRRIVHFEPTTLFATNTRSLAWDEVVKVKTYPPNIFWKQMAIGNVVIHARTPARPSEEDLPMSVSVDDIELKDVYYYRDLGNYIDKILFTYKQRPKEVTEIKPFIPRPRGERY